MNILQARNIKIYYEDEYCLKKFNSKLYVRRNIKRAIKKQDTSTIKKTVIAKINAIIDKVQIIFDVYIPSNNYHFDITILKDDKTVFKKFKEIYNIDRKYIAFYSRKTKMIYLSAKHSKINVVTHELGHAIAEMHFAYISPSEVLHEVMAQFAEKHIYS